jgi:hypothetical protein
VSADVFSVSVGVYDNSGENLKSASGFNYTISLSLSPYGQFLSDGPQLTKDGIAVFENLRIVSGGTYEIVPQSEGITIVEEYPVNISNYVHQVILKPQTISANFSLNVEIELYAETLFNGTCNLLLTEKGGSQVYGENSSVIHNGSLSIYFETTGEKVLNATCPSVYHNDTYSFPAISNTTNITIEQLTLNIVDFKPVRFT